MALKRDKMGMLSITGNKWEYVLYIVISLAVVYGFASLAVDSGSLLDYAGAIVFLISTVRLVRPTIRRFRTH